MKSTDNRRITIALWDLPNGETAKVSVSFPTFADMAKVYTLHVQPTRLEQYDGHTIERYEPRRGLRMTLETAPRYSRKRLETLAEDPATFEKARALCQIILSEVAPYPEEL